MVGQESVLVSSEGYLRCVASLLLGLLKGYFEVYMENCQICEWRIFWGMYWYWGLSKVSEEGPLKCEGRVLM